MEQKVTLFVAFTEGLMSFFLPCVLPMIPMYIAYLTGTTVSDIKNSRHRVTVVVKSVEFIIGFTLVFLLMGASVSTLGTIFSEYREVIQKVGGVIVILLGLHTTGLVQIKKLISEKKLISYERIGNNGSAVVVGIAFAAGWTPCIGPVLTSILLLSGSRESFSEGILLLLAYSLGLAIPFFITALFIRGFSGFFKKISKFIPIFSVICGILMILTGIIIFTNQFGLLAKYIHY